MASTTPDCIALYDSLDGKEAMAPPADCSIRSIILPAPRTLSPFTSSGTRTGLSRDATPPACQIQLTSRSEEHTSELQSLMRISYAVFCLKKKTQYTHRQQ